MIVSYLSVSLENIFLIRKLTSKLEQLASQIPNEQVAREFIWFRKLMFELQEKERFRIATDIHDTTMQDLFFLKRRLVALREKSKLLPEVVAQLGGVIEYVEVINTNLRQNCFELHPYLLQELGLMHTIRKLIESEAHSGGCETVLQVRGEEMIESWSLETKRHLFRIIQELLNNAKKHANAKKVLISMEVIGLTLRLTYQDDGVGFDSKRRHEREIGSSGVGMEQMKSRVLHLGGQLELTTSPGKGVQIHITIPTKEVLSA
jgi:two-component system sensor histidine kinase ComP